MRRPVQMRAESDTFFRDLPQFVQAENLEAAGVGENRPRPRHEAMQPTRLPHLLHSRAQIKMVSISQQDLNADVFENVLRNAFH